MGSGMRYCVVLLVINYACTTSSDDGRTAAAKNPPAPGFDLANSDPAAVELADSIMVAMGGRENWDNTRFISWNFEGRHDLVWDKQTGNVRIESSDDSAIYLLNVKTNKGRVLESGREVISPDSLSDKLRKARTIWANDSYWLVMPFRLKSNGVTLKYLGEERTDSARYNVLQLTITKTAVAPGGRYIAYVDLTDNLVKAWSDFSDSGPDTGETVLPWDNYRRYGNILLSADRTGGTGPRDVRVDSRLPDELFTEF
ncbi:MAG TPA: hypothetical protein VIH22_03890 [Cyclobacteriaceae bacterium]